jgi:aldose sugar dehydrogenase
VKSTRLQLVSVTVIVILVFLASAFPIYSFGSAEIETAEIETLWSLVDKKSNDGTTDHYHATKMGLQYDTGIKKIENSIELINRTEIPNTPISPEFIALLINGNITVGESNRVGSNPEFVFIDNQSGISHSSPSYWNSSEFCGSIFECSVNFTSGWRDNKSLQVSTEATAKDTYSWITGGEIDVNQNERYELVTHMKLDDAVRNSHIGLEAYDATLKNWKQIKQCPAGIDGPLEWRQFSCEVIIPKSITKVRPILNAGWATQKNEPGVTFFDNVFMVRLTDLNSSSNVPIIFDPSLKTEVVAEELKRPTSMAFLGPNDFLVLGKTNGTVHRIINGTMLPEPLLDVNVGNLGERGLLGIAIDTSNKNPVSNGNSITVNTTKVFLFLTESKDSDNNKSEPLRNRIYRYDLENNRLVNPKLLLELPLTKKTIHNGGVVAIGPDNNIYTVVGDLEKYNNYSGTMALNTSWSGPDGRSGILRFTQNGQPVNRTGILGDEYPLNLYYAYGIRNGFGLDFDPITGKLWDTENGPDYGDEINLVEPGFNSGHPEILGMQVSPSIGDESRVANTLEDFDGKGKYSDPEYEWGETIGPTAVTFLDSDKLGKKYENDMFVGDFNNGIVYHFDLNKERTRLDIDSGLYHRLDEKIIFARGFGKITDIEVGPDGYLYIVSINPGKIFRIVPRSL